MSNDTHVLTGEITNTCTCTEYDEQSGEYTDTPSDLCFGFCWDYQVEDFTMITEDFRKTNTTNWWKVSDLGLWNRNVSGYIYALPNDVERLLEGMTVNSDWMMRYTVFPDRIEYSLSHHDCLGSATTLTCVSAEEVEEEGLYPPRHYR